MVVFAKNVWMYNCDKCLFTIREVVTGNLNSALKSKV